MQTHKIKFIPSGKELAVKRNTTLYDAAMALGLPLQAECGGQGKCGMCVVKVEAGRCAATHHKKISADDEKKGYRLACRAAVSDDLVVYIPEESSLPLGDIDFGAIVLKEDEEKRKKVLQGLKLCPTVETIHIKLPPPTLEDNLDDFARLKRAIRKEGVEDDICCSLDTLKKMPRTLRAADWKVSVTLFRRSGCVELIGLNPTNKRKPLGLAIDLGTTTVTAELVDIETGGCNHRAVAYNHQLSCGADIISRIVYSDKSGGKERLRDLAIETIKKILTGLFRKTGLSSDDIAFAVVAGNTTMDHLLLGLDSEQIRLEPYIPAINQYPLLRADEVGLPINPSTPVYLSPAIGSYVGGDVVAGVLACGMHLSDELTLFIDAGTNGEIVLGNKDWMVGCACSTGPAFEGVGINCGMMAAPGAVEAVEIKKAEAPPLIKTLADAAARGICGSGMIDLMAQLFKCGILDRKGTLQTGDSSRIERRDGHTAYIIRRAGEEGAEKEIYLNDTDFKKLLRTKAAIQAAVRTVLNCVELNKDSIDRVVIAGRLGEAIDPSNAIAIGMLPDIPLEKFEYIGNGSLWGANMLLLSKEKMVEITKLADRITYIDLSTHPGYMEEFVASLFIPHTDL